MAKNSKGKTPSPVAAAGAGFTANSTSLDLASWAYRPGMPPAHSPEAQAHYQASHLEGHGPTQAPEFAKPKGKGKR
jgi:hypothetical protein